MSWLGCSGKLPKPKGRSRRPKRKYGPLPSEERRHEEPEDIKPSSLKQEASKKYHDEQGSNISIPLEGDVTQELLNKTLERITETRDGNSRFRESLECESNEIKRLEQKVVELERQLDEFKRNGITNTVNETAIGDSIPSTRENGPDSPETERRVKELENENDKLREDLKDERNKSRSSKQEATELKQQIEELKRNHYESPLSFSKRTEIKIDLDTDTLFIQAKIANEAANVLWKQQRKINKKQQNSTTKTLQKCIEKYNSSLAEIKDACKRMLDTSSDGGFIDMREGPESKLSRSLNELNRESDRLPTECMVCTKKDSKIKELEDRLKRIEKEDKENELQLSAIASVKMRDNNPNIADLSDQNRPTKIAEKLSDLYDNQWKDAYDALKRKQVKEGDVIELLKDLMMRAYGKCKSIASKKYFEKVQRFIELPIQGVSVPRVSVLPDTLKQQIKDFRKLRAEYVIEDLEKEIGKELKSAHSNLEAVHTYISSCIEISWLMVVQDPPLVLSSDVSLKFDTNLFKHYTRRGKYVEYVVWPVLHLHEGGAVLAKGVAQGCNHPR